MEAVDEEDDGEDVEVDFAKDASIFAGGNDDGGVVGLFEELGSFVSACKRSVGVGIWDRGNFVVDVLGVGVTLARRGFEVNNIRIVFLSSHDCTDRHKKWRLWE